MARLIAVAERDIVGLSGESGANNLAFDGGGTVWWCEEWSRPWPIERSGAGGS
ncbi:hypothetical protein [Occultella kanbiaonis]|uniref:hypothetical protein n=1 Tax=Occultella kanbiaonis TaxID=2675754 RepID=UPI0012B70CD8|nr:hypothetical protein [Occultella kanbiaonis]